MINPEQEDSSVERLKKTGLMDDEEEDKKASDVASLHLKGEIWIEWLFLSWTKEQFGSLKEFEYDWISGHTT